MKLKFVFFQNFNILVKKNYMINILVLTL